LGKVRQHPLIGCTCRIDRAYHRGDKFIAEILPVKGVLTCPDAAPAARHNIDRPFWSFLVRLSLQAPQQWCVAAWDLCY
jgi:hypothetical protein